MNPERWDDIGRQWRDKRLVPANGEEEWRRLAQAEAFRISMLVAHPPQPITSVLEVGCGVGRLTPHLARLFPSIVATDQSLVMLAITSGVCSELLNVKVQMLGTEPDCDLALVWGNMYDEEWSDEQAAEHGETLIARHDALLIQTTRIYLVGYWRERTVRAGSDWLLARP